MGSVFFIVFAGIEKRFEQNLVLPPLLFQSNQKWIKLQIKTRVLFAFLFVVFVVVFMQLRRAHNFVSMQCRKITSVCSVYPVLMVIKIYSQLDLTSFEHRVAKSILVKSCLKTTINSFFIGLCVCACGCTYCTRKYNLVIFNRSTKWPNRSGRHSR